MKLKIYNEILDFISGSTCFEKQNYVKELQLLYPEYSIDTFVSIYSQMMQRKIKKMFYTHHKPKNVMKYYRKYLLSEMKKEEGFLFNMAKDIDFPPTSLARIVLEQHLKEHLQGESPPKDIVSKLIKNPTKIQNKVLSKEIELCIKFDDNCGPLIEKLKQEIGLKYENMLQDKLKEFNIEYYAEENLRDEGYDKTPDFKLVVPISVKNHIVNWIESKALFGDSDAHSFYLDKQLWSYTNRFGPGLVIYWFGFIDELNVNVEQGLLMADDFPNDFQTLTELLDKHEREFVLKF